MAYERRRLIRTTKLSSSFNSETRYITNFNVQENIYPKNLDPKMNEKDMTLNIGAICSENSKMVAALNRNFFSGKENHIVLNEKNGFEARKPFSVREGDGGNILFRCSGDDGLYLDFVKWMHCLLIFCDLCNEESFREALQYKETFDEYVAKVTRRKIYCILIGCSEDNKKIERIHSLRSMLAEAQTARFSKYVEINVDHKMHYYFRAVLMQVASRVFHGIHVINENSEDQTISSLFATDIDYSKRRSSFSLPARKSLFRWRSVERFEKDEDATRSESVIFIKDRIERCGRLTLKDNFLIIEMRGKELRRYNAITVSNRLCNDLDNVTPEQATKSFVLKGEFSSRPSAIRKLVVVTINTESRDTWLAFLDNTKQNQLLNKDGKHEVQITMVQNMQGEKGNSVCADCKRAEPGGQPPRWILYQWGVLVCSDCVGVHRSFAHVHMCQSLLLDRLRPQALNIIQQKFGNLIVNSVIEFRLFEERFKFGDNSNLTREKYIKAKYSELKYCSLPKVKGDALKQKLVWAISVDDVQYILSYILQAQSDRLLNEYLSETDKRTFMHLAIQMGSVSAVYLLANNMLYPRRKDGYGRGLEYYFPKINGPNRWLQILDLLIEMDMVNVKYREVIVGSNNSESGYNCIQQKEREQPQQQEATTSSINNVRTTVDSSQSTKCVMGPPTALPIKYKKRD